MKAKCSKCDKSFQAPDEWAGKLVKCPGCKQPVRLPTETEPSTQADLGFDLGSLDALEMASQAVAAERRGKPMTLKEAQAEAAASAPKPQVSPTKADPNLRVCPQCRAKIRAPDPYTEVMCRHCGSGIPGLQRDEATKAKYTGGMKDRIKTNVSFYTGFTSAVLYPIPAMASILAGMGIALGIIALPLSGILAFLHASSLNEAVKEQPDLSWVKWVLTVMFVGQGIYFGSVAYYALLDSIRSTSSGSEQPPALTWNITKLGSALGGYAAFVGFYALTALILLLIAGAPFPPGADDIHRLGTPLNLAVLALLTFTIPMNLIGLSSSHAVDGLNPVRLGQSIWQVVGHYIFLFLITLIYLGFYVGIMFAVLNWAGPAIMKAAREGMQAGYLQVIGGVAAWSIVIGAGLYFAYSIGRILGLFARSYREQLEFEL